jgi:hypothetical protein
MAASGRAACRAGRSFFPHFTAPRACTVDFS